MTSTEPEEIWYNLDKKSLASKKIIFSTHAKERIKKRGLTEEWVIDIIQNHHISCGKRSDNTEEFRQERKGSYYYAVVEHKKSVLIVITAGESEK